MNNISLLSNAKRINFFKSPFPHLLIEDALPKEYYNILSSKFPINFFKSIEEENDNNVRKDLFNKEIKEKKDIDIYWKKFISYHSSKSFLSEILDFFYDDIFQKYPKKFKDLDFLKNLDTNNQLSTSVNTPVKKQSSVRGAHLDNLNKLFTGLFYMKIDEDRSSGGNLELYSWKKNYSNVKKRLLGSKDISMEHVIIEKTINYKPNTFIIFLNSIDSLHGVTPRSETEHYRRMCVFTSKLPFSLDDPTLIERIQLKLTSNLY